MLAPPIKLASHQKIGRTPQNKFAATETKPHHLVNDYSFEAPSMMPITAGSTIMNRFDKGKNSEKHQVRARTR